MTSDNINFLQVKNEFNSFLRKVTAFSKEHDCTITITIDAYGKSEEMFVAIIMYRGAQQRKVTINVLRFLDIDIDKLIKNLYEGNMEEVQNEIYK